MTKLNLSRITLQHNVIQICLARKKQVFLAGDILSMNGYRARRARTNRNVKAESPGTEWHCGQATNGYQNTGNQVQEYVSSFHGSSFMDILVILKIHFFIIDGLE